MGKRSNFESRDLVFSSGTALLEVLKRVPGVAKECGVGCIYVKCWYGGT